MPAKDLYHNAVKNALIKDGWTITHDPYSLSIGTKDVYVDLGAERTIAAEKGTHKIAVEVKSFVGLSDIREFELALGQYLLYRSALTRVEADRQLYLAVPRTAYASTFEEPVPRAIVEELKISIFTYDPTQEVIVQWRP